MGVLNGMGRGRGSVGWCALLALGASCSGGGSSGAVDASAEGASGDGASSCSDGAACDSAGAAFGDMRLLELTGTAIGDAGSVAVVELDAFVAFHADGPHDYDDRNGSLGCTADHYDATTRPAPFDADAGWVRMSGFSGGALLSGEQAAQPIVCMRAAGRYGCAYPTGTTVTGAFFAATSSPLGAGPVTFALNGGADFGTAVASDSPLGAATTQEDLSAIRYDTAADTVLHVSCSGGCTPGRIAVELTARRASSVDAGFPYSSVGVVRCVLAPATSLSVPRQAVAAMFASDAALDSVVTSVALLPPAPATATDSRGNLLVADVGRGVFGVAPR
ncbi:MAG TPA: hypothetical protein VE987_03235 [Polyangiaceae bacterium]|nr:hypothetical protein [Polyangiaceae bacterium]